MEIKKNELVSEFKIKRGNLLALHWCIKQMVDHEIPEPSEIGLLMSIMTKLATQDKETNKEFTIKIDNEHLEPCWHSCNIVLRNNLQKDHIQAEEIMVIIALIAKAIDDNKVMEVKPALILS